MQTEISPKELKSKLDAGENITVIDVREAWELEKGKLAGIVHIPMNDVPNEMDRIPMDTPVVIMCKSGNRSSQVTDWLIGQGYDNVLNLTGGITRWAKEIDPSLPTTY